MKDQIRIPRISEQNQFIKDEIIKAAEKMLGLENLILSDLVDFSDVLIQKFDDVSMEGENLLLKKDKNVIKLPLRENKGLVSKTILEKLGRRELGLEKQEIDLSELRALPAIDFELQKALKNYIDDLVFVLYFNVKLNPAWFGKADLVRAACEQNEFYKTVGGNKK